MMLELHNVTIGKLIKELSVTIDDGQIVGIQGRGKTTLLRAVVGLIPIDGGHIYQCLMATMMFLPIMWSWCVVPYSLTNTSWWSMNHPSPLVTWRSWLLDACW